VETLSLSKGQLSDVELRVLLPYLLSDEIASAKPGLWTYVGSMMSLDRLEGMWDVLHDVDVSALVVPNVETWTARRAQLVINSSFEGFDYRVVLIGKNQDAGIRPGDEMVDDLDAEPNLPSWYVRNRMLTAEVGRWRLFVTTDARRLKGRKDSATARWDDIAPLLTGFALDAVGPPGCYPSHLRRCGTERRRWCRRGFNPRQYRRHLPGHGAARPAHR
jgi:hypothetical protein